jgi:hypothetical protein
MGRGRLNTDQPGEFNANRDPARYDKRANDAEAHIDRSSQVEFMRDLCGLGVFALS